MTTEAPAAPGTPVVIIGAGLAGAKTAEALRAEGYDGPVVLIGDEPHLPYERPALSKGYLTGAKALPEFTVHTRGWYQEHDIELRLGVAATAIDTAQRTVTLADGTVIGYSSLVLATGSHAARPPITNADAVGVHTLRTVDDATALRAELTAGSRLAVIGGGWIGLEVAAVARSHDVQVTVVEAAEQPLTAPLGPQLGAVFADLHRQHGVDLRLGARVEAITTASGRATGVRLVGGATVPADRVLVAVGATPNIALAENAGIAVENGGVRVDSGLRTSAPHVYAVGDIAAAEHPFYGIRIRTEHWATALNQPTVAARNILGADAGYDRLPYFFTDQYDLGMEFVGRIAGYTRVIRRGHAAGGEALYFWLDDKNRVLAGMNVNIWDVTDEIKALVAGRTSVDPDRLADSGVPLSDLLSAAGKVCSL